MRNPIYRIVDDISISSVGSVYSVVVAHRGDISKIEEIELDPASKTAVNLLRCLLAELAFNWRLIRGVLGSTGCKPVVSGSLPDTKAWLLIGDQAIRFRQKHAGEFDFWDLGEQWRKLVDLPFVYALWLVRPEVIDPKQIAERLRVLRDENLTHLDDVIEDIVAGGGDPGWRRQFNREFLSRYYRQHLRFTFGEKEKEGLLVFADLCERRSLLPKRDLTFRVV